MWILKSQYFLIIYFENHEIINIRTHSSPMLISTKSPSAKQNFRSLWKMIWLWASEDVWSLAPSGLAASAGKRNGTPWRRGCATCLQVIIEALLWLSPKQHGQWEFAGYCLDTHERLNGSTRWWLWFTSDEPHWEVKEPKTLWPGKTGHWVWKAEKWRLHRESPRSMNKEKTEKLISVCCTVKLWRKSEGLANKSTWKAILPFKIKSGC